MQFPSRDNAFGANVCALDQMAIGSPENWWQVFCKTASRIRYAGAEQSTFGRKSRGQISDQVRHIQKSAFDTCEDLAIPSPIEILETGCFHCGHQLTNIIFQPDPI
jgi:hypothetical protein